MRSMFKNVIFFLRQDLLLDDRKCFMVLEAVELSHPEPLQSEKQNRPKIKMSSTELSHSL